MGARHWTRLNAPDHWKADALLDRIVSGPLRFVQAKWWTVFPSFSLVGSRRSITMRLAFQGTRVESISLVCQPSPHVTHAAPNGEVLDEVPFNAVLQGWGPQAELSYRIQVRAAAAVVYAADSHNSTARRAIAPPEGGRRA